ncbi:Uncharacterized protein JF73_18090 (plasmid) [Lactobacillus helsingborgensis]|uniref:PepSY domain-containing protein n=2 Tax=Lactobacillus TaxID=1578 RepID=A0AA47B5L0_9LACO|nr:MULTISPECIES: hypothetical protein [Lactobacillus]KJY54789.1 Uncharacterized protein JF74_19750 [Lactobacillus melliventris]KJY60384.1 Uncharacterized protein JF73_18090 [Lactobacillus helsingborgensis]UZX30567.1 hypothetical protein LDX53_09320 [Lactobacillus helsingborgensis]
MKTKKPVEQYKKSRKLLTIWLAAAIVTVIIVLGIIAISVNIYRHYNFLEIRQKDQAHQEQIRKTKSKPKFKEYHSSHNVGSTRSKNLTKKQVNEHIKADINFAFKIMKATGASAGSTINYKQLNFKQGKIIYKYYNSLTPLNELNQLTNVSTQTGSNYYGQNGHNKKYNTPKQGDTYVINQIKTTYLDKTYNSYIYDVFLQYKAGKFSVNRYLEVTVNQSTGAIASVKGEGSNLNE